MGCVGVGVGAFRGKERSYTPTSKTDDAGHVAKEGYVFVGKTETHEDVGATFGVSIGYKMGVSFTSVPGKGFSSGLGTEAHLDFRYKRLMLTGGYASEGASSDGVSLRYTGLFGQLTYFAPLSSILFVHVGAAVQDGTATFATTPDATGQDSDALGVRGLAGVTLVVPLDDFPDLMFRVEGRYTRSQEIVVAGEKLNFSSVSMLGETLFFF